MPVLTSFRRRACLRWLSAGIAPSRHPAEASRWLIHGCPRAVSHPLTPQALSGRRSSELASSMRCPGRGRLLAIPGHGVGTTAHVLQWASLGAQPMADREPPVRPRETARSEPADRRGVAGSPDRSLRLYKGRREPPIVSGRGEELSGSRRRDEGAGVGALGEIDARSSMPARGSEC